jgi:hypothetical protein
VTASNPWNMSRHVERKHAEAPLTWFKDPEEPTLAEAINKEMHQTPDTSPRINEESASTTLVDKAVAAKPMVQNLEEAALVEEMDQNPDTSPRINEESASIPRLTLEVDLEEPHNKIAKLVGATKLCFNILVPTYHIFYKDVFL